MKDANTAMGNKAGNYKQEITPINRMEAQNTTNAVDLVELYFYLLRKWKVTFVSVLLGFIISAIYIFIIATPMYESTSQIYVVTSRDSMVNLSDLQIGSYLTTDYQLVFDTWEVNQQVINNLRLPYTVNELRAMTAVTNPSNTRALFITVRSANAKEAAAIANEYASVASKYISDTMMTDLPTVMSTALESINSVSPQKMQTLLIGMLLGGFLSIMVLTIIFIFDDKIKTSSDNIKYTGAAPLAVIPLTKSSQGDKSRGW